MKKIILITSILCSISLLSCDVKKADTDPAPELNASLSCNVADPINDLSWLKSIVTTLDSYKAGHRAVKLVDYKSVSYIVVEEIYSSSPASTIYDCQGNQALKSINVTYNQFINDAKETKVLYSKE